MMVWIVLLAVMSTYGALAISHFGGSEAVLDCSRPEGIPLSTAPAWIINQTTPLSTSNAQKYSDRNDGLQLTVHNLQYGDAGQYSCQFTQFSGTVSSSAGSIEIIGRPVFDCGSAVCGQESVCLVRGYEALTVDLRFSFESFGMPVGNGQRPFQFTVMRNGNARVATCTDNMMGQCDNSGTLDGVSFDGDFESQLTAIFTDGSLITGLYSVIGYYRDHTGAQNDFTKDINVTVRSCQSLDDLIIGNVSVEHCVATYECLGGSENQTAMCQNSNEWEELGCQAIPPTPDRTTISTSATMQVPTLPLTSSTMRTVETPAPSTSNSLLIIIVTIPIIVVILTIITVILVSVVVAYHISISKHLRNASMYPAAIHAEDSTVSANHFEASDSFKIEITDMEKKDLCTGNARPLSAVSLPENDVSLPDKFDVSGMCISHSQVFQV